MCIPDNRAQTPRPLHASRPTSDQARAARPQVSTHHHVLGVEVESDGRQRLQPERVPREAGEQVALADARVTDEYN